ncbi:hypothetical protein CZ794_09890 [Psychrobacter sp. JB385]|nr:hypothetical protein CZ794_09890 [Psychrobacter sp. JB385]
MYDGVILNNAASDKEQINEIPMATTTKNTSNNTLVAVGSAIASVATAPAPAAKAEEDISNIKEAISAAIPETDW